MRPTLSILGQVLCVAQLHCHPSTEVTSRPCGRKAKPCIPYAFALRPQCGLPDLLLTSWVAGRDRPLKLFGPEGTASMAKNIIAAYEEDIRYRLYSDQPANNQGGASPQPRSLRLESFSKIITSRLRPFAYRTVAGPTPGVIDSQHRQGHCDFR